MTISAQCSDQSIMRASDVDRVVQEFFPAGYNDAPQPLSRLQRLLSCTKAGGGPCCGSEARAKEWLNEVCECVCFFSLSHLAQPLANYEKISKDSTLLVATDLLCSGPRRFQFLGTSTCAECYCVIHEVTKYRLRQARKLLQTPINQSYSDSLFGHYPLPQRDALLRNHATEFISKWCHMRRITTSRDGSTNYLPFKPMISLVYYDYVQEEGRDGRSPASYEIFRQAFHEEIKNWAFPRYKNEVKACETCWDLYRLILRAQRQGEEENLRKYRSQLAEHQTLAYSERQEYYADRIASKEDNLTLCLIADFTFPFNLFYHHQRTRQTSPLPQIAVGFGALIDHSARENGGGAYYYWNIAASGKDDANTVCSLIYHYLSHKQKNGADFTGKTLKLQLDNGGSNKCLVTLGFCAWVRVHFGFHRVFVSFLIRGHTGEDVDGITASMRIKLRSNFDYFSLSSVKDNIFPRAFPFSESAPTIFQFLDLEHGEQWQETDFNKQFDHFLYDFDTFLKGTMNDISGFTGKGADRTEHTIHAWKFDEEGRFSATFLRSLPDPQWSDPIPVFSRLPRAGSLPKRLFHGSPRHVISAGVDFQQLEREILAKEMLNQMDPTDIAFWRSFFDEVHQCKVPNVAPDVVAGKKQKRKSYARRTIDLNKPPVITFKERASNVISDEEDDVYSADSGSEVSSEEEEDAEARQWEQERYEVAHILQKQARDDGIQYLVEFKDPMEGELPEWISAHLLTSDSALAAIRAYEDKQENARRNTYKTTGEVLSGRTRSQNKRQ